MPKYIIQLRRGTKEQWKEYEENKPAESMPLDGELVVEFDNGIPRLKIGDGVNAYSKLPYMSVDSFILPKPASVTLYGGEAWIKEEGCANRYYQVVKDDYAGNPIDQFANAIITSNSKIDLQPDPNQLEIFHEKDLAFVAENDGGKVVVYCIGQQPQNDYVIQVAVTEVMANG